VGGEVDLASVRVAADAVDMLAWQSPDRDALWLRCGALAASAQCERGNEAGANDEFFWSFTRSSQSGPGR